MGTCRLCTHLIALNKTKNCRCWTDHIIYLIKKFSQKRASTSILQQNALSTSLFFVLDSVEKCQKLSTKIWAKMVCTKAVGWKKSKTKTKTSPLRTLNFHVYDPQQVPIKFY